MLKKTILLFSILALLLSVTSCSKKELTTEEKLTRYWNFAPQNETTASDSVHFLSLKNINNENIFHIYRGQDTNTGTWQVVDNKELVLFSPLQNMETDVDSIV